MNWNHELLESGLWILKAYAITVVLAGLAIWALVRFTIWGRQFWTLAKGYFSPKRSWQPLIALAFILFLTLCGVRLDVLFSSWYNNMYTALQKLDETEFWFAMWLFAVLATTHVIRSLIDFYVEQAFTIHWRVWLNEQMLSRWLDHQAYYRTQYLDKPTDNPDQRIQQDVNSFVSTSLTLSMGVVNALVSTFAFTLILWNLSGPLSVMGLDIPRGMVFLVFLYVLVATVFAIRIGRPLISLNFLNERFNADYRYALVRLREYAESVAFYAGEKVEGALLRNRFAQVIANSWAIVYRSLKFLGFNFSITQAAVVFPFIIQAQRFFTKKISLGDLIQTAQAFGRLQDNLSFFRNAYDSFAAYRATLDRLTGFTTAIRHSYELPTPQVQAQGKRVALDHLTVLTPSRQLLINRLSLEVQPGAPLLIRGASGSGKTTLLRSIAGLWPYCEGGIIRPESGALFLSQKPYLPLGSLREALYYPSQLPGAAGTSIIASPQRQQEAAMTSSRGGSANLDTLLVSSDSLLETQPSNLSDGQAQEVLKQVQLGHLIDKLDEVADWGRILSLGEQQRLAFGRMLLARPDAAFLDEASSALDEGLEESMYRLTREHLPDMILLSVGHRSTLVAHHSRQLIIKGGGAWELS
ncbi:ABC transporter ATP-binding protein/permease [Paralcaligenes sp. KSB-10]|uniref:ABC transporter ATP-binding protein/permease n=1 Tax=Paralcaligenes sp. KSB-10 TaxID=2901142 RepID=UPI001E2A448F|nr:ABC transporter ATP-binding protein/permease [Paralcaligenes sp. KSB-10]UHL65362.1 ABC transporter ATP-binding protein/permease [Paralcaligenes sp. KSB-10]